LFYEALLLGDYEISREDLEVFLAKFLADKQVAVSSQELLRYEQDLRNIFLLHAEFDAATDALNKEAAKTLRDPAEIAADFRDEVNQFTKKLGKIADPVGEENRNVRSFNPVAYKGANRILGILAFDPEAEEGIVAYGANNPETVKAAQRINDILEVDIQYITSRDERDVKLPYIEQSDFEEYVDIMVRYAVGETAERMSEWWYTNGDEAPLQEALNLEKLQEDTGVPAETLAKVLVENKEEVSTYVEETFDPDSLDFETWSNRLNLYETAQTEVKDLIKCMTTAGLEDEIDSRFFREVVAPYSITGYYDATNVYFEGNEEVDVDAIDKCLGYSGEGPLTYKIFHLAESVAWGRVFDIVAQWFEEEYEPEEQRAASVKETGMTKKKLANPNWWGTADENFYVDPNDCIPVQDILEEFDEMLAIQCSDGNWNFDPYMHGMANGMLFMKSMIDGRDPLYMEAPETWLVDIPSDGLPVPVADECYDDEFGNQVCEGEPVVEDSSLALVPFEEAAEEDALEADDDKVYFASGAARSRGLNFVYPKAEEPWRPPQRGKNLYYPDPRREGKKGRLPFKKVRRRKEKHPVIVDTCGRNYIPEECREDYEKGFNAIAAAFAPFVRIAVVPYEEWEESEWKVVDTHSEPLTDTEMYGTGPYEDIRERESFGGWEGEGTLEVDIGGVKYTIDLDWNLAPDAKGPEDVELRVWVKGGPEDLKIEMRDGSVMTAKEFFTTQTPQIIWDYDLNTELFPPPGEPEYEDPRIP
jgi:hypothetical protein